jgi:hypothetical protein
MQRRTLSRRWWLVLLAIGGMLLMGSSSRTHAAGHEILAGLTAPLQPASLPAFRLPRVGGTTLSAADLRGKVVLMRFWSTW